MMCRLLSHLIYNWRGEEKKTERKGKRRKNKEEGRRREAEEEEERERESGTQVGQEEEHFLLA